jgi:hypothetical protein
MQLKRTGGIKLGGRALVVSLVAGAALAAVSAPAAVAGEYAAFAQCPTSTSGVKGCISARTESGEITIGSGSEKTEVPIEKSSKPQTLQGGFGRANEETGQMPFYEAKNGETLTKAPQKVPGGLAGLVKCNKITEPVLRFLCELAFENGFTGVNATTELAAPASSIYLNEFAQLNELPYPPYPPGLVLPIKIHLENTYLLGSSCYIGSNSEPIELALTTGTTNPPAPNKPIKGKFGEETTKGEGRILVVKNNTLVGNAWKAPKASGCGAFGLLDGIIDEKIGLPAAAGDNTAVLNNTIEQAGKVAVEESGE